VNGSTENWRWGGGKKNKNRATGTHREKAMKSEKYFFTEKKGRKIQKEKSTPKKQK